MTALEHHLLGMAVHVAYALDQQPDDVADKVIELTRRVVAALRAAAPPTATEGSR